PVGLLQPGDAADFILVDSLDTFNILKTYIDGQLVAENGKSLLEAVEIQPINNFNITHKKVDDFKIKASKPNPQIRVIEALDGQLVTNEIVANGKTADGCLVSDVEHDILKMAVVNRYTYHAFVSIGFIKNIGIKAGAIASPLGHDCHNFIAVGADDESLCLAVNALVDSKVGIAVVENGTSY